MSQDRIFLLFTTGIVGLVFLGCVILGVTIYINLPAWLPPSATTSDHPSGAATATGPAPAPWHIQAPLTGSATQPATLTHRPAMTSQPASTAPLSTHTLVPLTLPANTALPTHPPQAVASPIPVQSPTRTPALPIIGAKPTGAPSPSTPTARPTASRTSTPTAQTTNNLTRTSTPSPSPTVGQSGGGNLHGEAGGMAVTVVSATRHADAGQIELVVEVILENVSRNDRVPYDSQFFSLQDSEGNWYPASEFAPEPSLTVGMLALGASDRGNVAFDITDTPAARGFVLTYDPTSLGGDYEMILIDLGQ